MKNITIKKRYLLKNPKEAVALLSMASNTIKKNITSVYFETATIAKYPLGVISFAFSSLKESLACRASMAEFILEDVSEDKRYKRRYLEFFGLPEGYDFELDATLSRLETLGTKPLEFSFHAGMSTQKVFKVLLYKNVIELEAYKSDKKEFLEKIEQCLALLRLFVYVYDAKILGQLHDRFEVLQSIVTTEDASVVDALVQTENYRLLLLDLGYVVLEEGDFYARKDMPILFFIRKRLKNEKSKLLKKIKKSLYM